MCSLHVSSQALTLSRMKATCVQFNKSVFPRYQSAMTQKHAEAAVKELEAGNYVQCSADAEAASAAMMAGN